MTRSPKKEKEFFSKKKGCPKSSSKRLDGPLLLGPIAEFGNNNEAFPVCAETVIFHVSGANRKGSCKIVLEKLD